MADPIASECSSSGDDAGTDAASHELLQETDVPEVSGDDGGGEGDAVSEPRGLGIDVQGCIGD